MKTCLAYVTTGHAPHAWRPCRNLVRRGCVLCRHHEKALAGIMIGLSANGYPDPVEDLRRSRRAALLEHMPVRSQRPS
jgi:hypothetical protein